jgi:type IV secretion system protein VirD4
MDKKNKEPSTGTLVFNSVLGLINGIFLIYFDHSGWQKYLEMALVVIGIISLITLLLRIEIEVPDDEEERKKFIDKILLYNFLVGALSLAVFLILDAWLDYKLGFFKYILFALMAIGFVPVVISLMNEIGKAVDEAIKEVDAENKKTSDIFGSSDYASLEQLREKRLLTGAGIPLGVWVEESGMGKNLIPIHYSGDRHLITIAPTRSGKGTTAQIPALLEHDAPLFMIDPKGENAVIAARCRRDKLGHKVFIVNPFGVLREEFQVRGFSKAARFNPLAALDPEGDTFLADVAALCEALILTEGKDPHWSNSARDLVACFIMHVCLKAGEKRTLPRVRELLTLPNEEYQEQIIEMAADSFPPLRQKAGRFVSASNEMGNIRSTAITQTGFLDDPALIESLSGDDFRFLDLKHHKISVFLVLPAKLVTAYARWFRLLVVSALDSLMSTEEKGEKPVLFMLDEFASLGHLSSVENAMGLAAGFGVQLWPFVQDIHQLRDIYDRRWQSFLANVGIQQYFTPNDSDTAEHISRRAGHKTVVIKSRNKADLFSSGGNSTSYAETGRPLLPPDDLYGMLENKQLLFAVGLKHTIHLEKRVYRNNPAYDGLWDENPYFKGKVKESDPLKTSDSGVSP